MRARVVVHEQAELEKFCFYIIQYFPLDGGILVSRRCSLSLSIFYTQTHIFKPKVDPLYTASSVFQIKQGTRVCAPSHHGSRRFVSDMLLAG